MNIAYVRVSTVEQNPGRQYEDLKKYNIDKWFEEKASGKDTKRPVLNEMLSFARDGDTIYIESFSRLARNTTDLLKIIDDLKKKNVKIISQKENLECVTFQVIFSLLILFQKRVYVVLDHNVSFEYRFVLFFL